MSFVSTDARIEFLSITLIALVLVWLISLLLKRTGIRGGNESQEVLLIIRKNCCLQEYLDDADKMAQTLSLGCLIQNTLTL